MRRKIVKLFTFGLVEILFLSGMLMGIAVVQAQSDDGLMAEWHFDEGSGGVVRDSSGNRNDGVIQGATWTEGKVGKALGTPSQWSGKWEGTTSEGRDVSFIVAEKLVYDFTIKYATVCNGERRCCYTFTVGFPFEIVQNVFQYEDYNDWPVMGKEGTWIYGEFTSPSFATGTFRHMWQEQQGKITCDKGTITWNATRKETLVTPIQSKIDSAKPGDIIIIEDGIYNENVKVNKQLTIRSRNGYDKTIIQAAISGAPIFDVTTDYVNISGFTVKGAKTNTGIYLHKANLTLLY